MNIFEDREKQRFSSLPLGNKILYAIQYQCLELSYGVILYTLIFFLSHKSIYSCNNHLFLKDILGYVKGSEFCHYLTDRAPQEANI
jgi:hypothetical protein